MRELLPYLGIVVLIAFSAFFSGSEIAFASVNTLRLQSKAEKGSKPAQVAHYICQQYDKALCTILIGNNLVNIASSSLATVIALQLVGDSGAIYATGVMTVLILTFGEIMPKIVAKDQSDGFVLLVSYPLRLLMLVTKPLVIAITWILDRIAKLWGGTPEPDPMTADELMTMIETVEDEGVIDEDRSDLLQSAVSFGETTVEQVLTPRVDLVAIDLQDSREDILHTMETSRFSRIPVYEEDIDSIQGILYLNHAYRVLADAPDTPIRELLLPAVFLHRSTRLPIAMRELRSRRLQMAVVLDDFGGTCGVVTLEDILEEIVGDIWDENDTIEEDFCQLDETHFRLSGSVSLDDLLWEADLEQFEDEFDSTTVGGWITELNGGFPTLGQELVWKNLRLKVDALDDRRVLQVSVEILPKQEEAEDED